MSIDPSTLRNAQLIILDILVEFDAICERHNLKYCLDSGMTLGAVRYFKHPLFTIKSFFFTSYTGR